MEGPSVFDSLVAELSAEERKELLERLGNNYLMSGEPLASPDELAAARREAQVPGPDDLGFFQKIILFFRRLFTGRDIESLLEEDELKVLARLVDQRFPGLVDYRKGIVTYPFFEEVAKLRDSARFFYGVLERSFDRDRPAFYAFLASLRMPDLNARLLAETDAFAWAKAHPEAGDPEARQAVLAAFDEIVLSLTDEGRRKMYQDIRCLFFLKRLSGFLFDRLLLVFRVEPGSEADPTASFAELRELLVELGDILFSLSSPPSIELMESIFLFVEKENLEKEGSAFEGLLVTDLGQAESALARIRAFNRKIPLVDLVRLVTEDSSHSPRELAAGEDWLAIFRSFWRSRIETGLDELRKERRYLRLKEEMAAYVGQASPPVFQHIGHDEGQDKPPIIQDLALGFIDSFTRGVFSKDFQHPLKIVLMDGEFYRKDNRLEFTDAFDTLSRGSASVMAFDARLGPEGEIGEAWMAARHEVSSVAIKRRKMQSIARSAQDESETIIRNYAESLIVLIRVLYGILKGEAGGRYDSLSNLSFLDGKGNKEFQKGLAFAKDRCEKAPAFLVSFRASIWARLRTDHGA